MSQHMLMLARRYDRSATGITSAAYVIGRIEKIPAGIPISLSAASTGLRRKYDL
jgi:hypothetical protein